MAGFPRRHLLSLGLCEGSRVWVKSPTFHVSRRKTPAGGREPILTIELVSPSRYLLHLQLSREGH